MLRIFISTAFLSAAAFLGLNPADDGTGSTTPNNLIKLDELAPALIAEPDGEVLFDTYCSSCHEIENAGIGPRLGGVTEVKSESELLAFIQNPAKVVASGDPRAVAQYEKYKLMMPAFEQLKETEIKAIIAYIGQETKAKNIAPLVVEIKEAEVKRFAKPVQASPLRIELEEYAAFPATSDRRMAEKRIAILQAHPSGDGTQFVGDQNGVIYRIKDKQLSTFLDVRPLIENFVAAPGLGTGLGSFTFHPDYLKNGLIYITHTETPTGIVADYFYADSVKVMLQWVVSEWKIKDVNAPVFSGTHRELLRIDVPNVVHGTQEIAFVPGLKKGDPDYGMLYIGTGDGGATIKKHPELTHDLRSLLGTIIRIDPLGRNSPNGKYGIPADNPFYNDPDPKIRQEIWAYGFRNPHRLTWWNGPQGRVMIEVEIGEGNSEEINIVEKGVDYGWNIREGDYALDFDNLNAPKPVPSEGAGLYRAPFAQYDHTDGNAIGGGYVYDGPLTALRNKYIFGDISRGRLMYLDISKGFTNPTIYEMLIVQNGELTTMKKMVPTPRLDLRVTYDPYKKEMYLMTKGDGKMRKIVKAYSMNKE